MARAPAGLPEPHELKNGRWRVAVQRGAGSREHRNRVFLSGSSEDVVRRRRDDWLRAQAEGRRLPDPHLTTATYLRRWLAAHVVRETTQASYHLSIERHVIPYIGSIPLSELGPLDIDDMLDRQKAKGVPPATRRYSVRVLSVALNVAVRKKRLILFNPAVGANEVTVTRREPTVLTVEEAHRLIDVASGDRLGPLLTLLATTGARRGEALALDWANWDRDAGTLRIEATLLYRPGRGFERVAPKTKRSFRTLRLPVIAQAALRDQSRRQAQERLMAGPRWHDQGLIFTGVARAGGALSGATVVHALHRLCEAAEVPRIRVHDLRHFYATRLGEAGLSDLTRMAVLGHTTREMTDHYTHVSPTSSDAAEAIDALFGTSVDALVDAIGSL
jgi:integrase